MLNLAYRILKRIRVHGRGKWVCTPKDFLDLGSRAAVDQALSRLVKSGLLRRISRGLYDFPRMSQVLNRPAPPNVDAAINALARRNNARIMPDGIVAANQLGLTNAVPAKTSYVTSGATRTLKIGGRTVYLRHARQRLMVWDGRPATSVIQALYWLGSNAASSPDVIDILKRRLSDDVKDDLTRGIKLLPSWIASIVHKITLNRGATA
jgi:hypothetical protein